MVRRQLPMNYNFKLCMMHLKGFMNCVIIKEQQSYLLRPIMATYSEDTILKTGLVTFLIQTQRMPIYSALLTAKVESPLNVLSVRARLITP